MARVKIDWSKVEFSGSDKPADVFGAAPARIQAIVKGEKATGSVSKVALTVKDSQFGAAFLKLKGVTADALDGILAELKDAGIQAVTDAYNDYARAKTLAFLQTNFGDLSEQIASAVKVLMDIAGLDEATAYKTVIDGRKAKGLRIPGEPVKVDGETEKA
jgi:hypothetical protein